MKVRTKKRIWGLCMTPVWLPMVIVYFLAKGIDWLGRKANRLIQIMDGRGSEFLRRCCCPGEKRS